MGWGDLGFGGQDQDSGIVLDTARTCSELADLIVELCAGVCASGVALRVRLSSRWVGFPAGSFHHRELVSPSQFSALGERLINPPRLCRVYASYK